MLNGLWKTNSGVSQARRSDAASCRTPFEIGLDPSFMGFFFTNCDGLSSSTSLCEGEVLGLSPSLQGCKDILAATPFLGTFLRAPAAALRR